MDRHVKKKFYKDFGITYPNKKLSDQKLFNMFQVPSKDKGKNMPHFSEIAPNLIQQADILFLPDDNGYKYALVVVDNGSRFTDAEPLKNKDNASVINAFKKIYNRGILKMPRRIEVDSGTEFKGTVENYFNDNDVNVRYAQPGRHRQQALVERKNQSIGGSLFKRMYAQEMLTGEVDTQWVEDLPTMIKALNKKAANRRIPKPPEEPVCKGDSCNLLQEGMKVRVALDEPREYLSQKKLHGRFRATDIRWDPKVREIEELKLIPGRPPMYKIEGKEHVNYTKNQLQVVPEKEEAPPSKVIRGNPNTYVIEKILDAKKVKGNIYYKIKWLGFNDPKYDSWEPRSTIIKSAPELVKEYELASERVGGSIPRASRDDNS